MRLEYEAVGKLVTVTCVQVFETSTLETTPRTRVVDRFLLHMPGPVTGGGSTHDVEGGGVDREGAEGRRGAARSIPYMSHS